MGFELLSAEDERLPDVRVGVSPRLPRPLECGDPRGLVAHQGVGRAVKAQDGGSDVATGN